MRSFVSCIPPCAVCSIRPPAATLTPVHGSRMRTRPRLPSISARRRARKNKTRVENVLESGSYDGCVHFFRLGPSGAASRIVCAIRCGRWRPVDHLGERSGERWKPFDEFRYKGLLLYRRFLFETTGYIHHSRECIELHRPYSNGCHSESVARKSRCWEYLYPTRPSCMNLEIRRSLSRWPVLERNNGKAV